MFILPQGGPKVTIHPVNEPDTDTPDNDDTDGVPQNKYLLALQIGQAFNLSFVSILKYAQYADAIDSIYACEPTIAEQILTSRVKVSHDNAMLISQLSPEELRKLRTGFDAGKYDRLVSSQIWHEVRTNRKTTTSRPRKKAEQPKAEIKNMPKYDPDAELLSLTLTIPMWKSSMERVKTTADFNHTSENAKKELTRTAKERRAGSLGYAEAIVTFYNKRSRFGLSMEKLYTHKSKKKEDGETSDPAPEKKDPP